MFEFLKKCRKSEIPNYFPSQETSCECGCGMDIKPELREVMNKLRHELGEPMVVNSGARCENHNKAVGGSLKSAHLMGLALDIRAISPPFREKLEKLRKKYGLRRGKYRRFFHLDLLLSTRNDFEGDY